MNARAVPVRAQPARAVLAALLAALLAGCASDPFSSYPSSLYDVIEEGSVDARYDHVELLGKIVAHNEKLGRPPPPGILAELAWYKASLGEASEVADLLARERELYPESGTFVTVVEKLLLGPEEEEMEKKP